MEARERLRILLLTLWDKAVPTKDYDKEQWLELQTLIRKEIGE